MAENPYDLSAAPKRARAAEAKRYPSREYDAEEILRLTEGYNKLEDPSTWPGIPPGSHLRFLKKDGKFLPGGFLHNYHHAKDGRRVFFIETGFRPTDSNYVKFQLDLASVQTVWKKDDKVLLSVADFAEITRQLVARVERIERNLEHVATILDRLSSAKS